MSVLIDTFPIFTSRFHTVDGRNPAPVDMVNIPSFTRFHECWVVQDFFRQQYCWGSGFQEAHQVRDPTYRLIRSVPFLRSEFLREYLPELQRCSV